MMTVILTALMTWLYPWNVEFGGFATAGETSAVLSYQAGKAYLSLDRWRKDAIVVRVHQFRLEDFYTETGVSARAFRWWRDEFKTGVDAGLLSGDSDAWFVGGRIEGAFPWIGYQVAVHELISGDGRFYPEVPVDRSRTVLVRLRRQLGPFLIEPGVQTTMAGNDTYWMPRVRLSGWISRWVFVELAHGFGEARFPVDVDLLTADLAAYRIVATYRTGLTVRLSPHLYVHGSFDRTDYSPATREVWDQRVDYLTVGFNVRY